MAKRKPAMLPAHPDSGYCDIQGRRPTIEDFHTVHIHSQHLFLGVFDGHNGNLASKFAASSCYDQLAERMSDLDHNVTTTGGSWKIHVESEISAAFENLHKGILGAIERSPEGVMKSTGTTATVLFRTQMALILANVGDSRAILSNGTHAPIQLSIDHVASNEAEEERIKRLGGFVSSVGGTQRVNGTLAVSRSLGDAHLASLLSRKPHVVAMSKKEIENHCHGTSYCFMVIACKSMNILLHLYRFDRILWHFKLTPLFFFWIICFTADGLWDVMSNQEVNDMVVQVMEEFDPSHGITWEEGGAYQEAAQMLTHEAYIRGSSDNIGVCVVAMG